MDGSPADDNALAEAAARGDQSAFDALVLRYRAYIYTVAYNVVLNPDDALDVTQNVYMKLVEKIGAYNGRGSFRAWLGTVAGREAIDFLRRRGRETVVEPGVLAAIVEDRQSGSGGELRGELDRRAKLERVARAFEFLSGQQRAIFALMLHDDLSPGEIAARLNIPARQVSTQIHRGMSKLRAAVGADANDGDGADRARPRVVGADE